MYDAPASNDIHRLVWQCLSHKGQAIYDWSCYPWQFPTGHHNMLMDCFKVKFCYRLTDYPAVVFAPILHYFLSVNRKLIPISPINKAPHVGTKQLFIGSRLLTEIIENSRVENRPVYLETSIWKNYSATLRSISSILFWMRYSNKVLPSVMVHLEHLQSVQPLVIAYWKWKKKGCSS